MNASLSLTSCILLFPFWYYDPKISSFCLGQFKWSFWLLGQINITKRQKCCYFWERTRTWHLVSARIFSLHYHPCDSLGHSPSHLVFISILNREMSLVRGRQFGHWELPRITSKTPSTSLISFLHVSLKNPREGLNVLVWCQCPTLDQSTIWSWYYSQHGHYTQTTMSTTPQQNEHFIQSPS